MGKPRRTVLAAVEASATPPDLLTASQSVARVVKTEGTNLYTCALPSGKTILVELEQRFRNAVWIKRGGYVLVDVASAAERGAHSKVAGDIINVVRDERTWRKQAYWPEQFAKRVDGDDDDDEDDDDDDNKNKPSLHSLTTADSDQDDMS